jgi:hypothetical protein
MKEVITKGFIDSSHKPFVLSLWFDRLTTIGSFPNVLSEAEGRVQGERFFFPS